LNSKVSLDELSLCFDAPLQRIRPGHRDEIAGGQASIAVLSKRESQKGGSCVILTSDPERSKIRKDFGSPSSFSWIEQMPVSCNCVPGINPSHSAEGLGRACDVEQQNHLIESRAASDPLTGLLQKSSVKS